MNRIELKNKIIEEAKCIIEKHPSKDARFFASQVLKYFEQEAVDVISELRGSVTENSIKGKTTIGCVL